MEVPEGVCSKENECAKAQEDSGETEAVQQRGVEEENKSDWALPSTVGQVDDLAPTSGDEEILSPIEHEAPSPFREREEKSRTPDSEDPMSSDEGGGGGFPSLLLRRLPPDGHEFPTAYSEPSLPKAPPPPSATSSAPSSQEDALPLKKPMHVYEDSGIFSDDPLSSLSASEGEEKTKVSVTKSPKECCSRQGDGRAAVSGEEAPWTNGVDKDSTSSPPPPTMIAAEPPPAAAMPKEDTKCLPATFASTPLPTPTAQYSSPLILDRRASAEATQKRYSGMLASMLETTKFGTKLKGLVIPDKPKAPATVAKTLPVIVSNSVVPSSNKMVSAMDDCKLRRDSKHSPPSPKHTTLLADPPWKTKEVSEVPKYSPAFKRRSLQVSKSCDVSPVRGSSQNGFQFSLSHSKPVTPVLPETPVMSPPPLSYTSSGSRSRSNSSSSTFSNPSSSGCSLEIAKKSRADSYAMSDGEQKQAPTVVAETPVANGKPYGQSPLLERYLSSATYDEKNAEAKVSRQNSVKSVSSTDSRSDQKTITNGYDGPSAKYNSERRSSAEIQRKNSLGSADAVIQEAKAQTVSASSSPPQLQRLPSTETKCDESRKAARTWDASSLKDAKTKYRSMDDRSWNSQFRRNSCEQPVYSTRVNSASSLSADQRTRSMDLKESPSEAWQKSVRASQLGQQKTVLKKTIDSADSAKSFKALAQNRASSLSSVLDVVDEPDVSASASPVTEAQQSPTPAKHEKIVLVKDGLGLGFTLEGGKDSPLGDKPLVVKRIFRGEGVYYTIVTTNYKEYAVVVACTLDNAPMTKWAWIQTRRPRLRRGTLRVLGHLLEAYGFSPEQLALQNSASCARLMRMKPSNSSHPASVLLF
ncbi:hypothetical protein HPB52_015695 [Rhipicephalus sanguineus]|uniref:Uncharacterized protein n=1 Tax=Rhipicephalus sanguineus TaxID=34632 RepID=A0A9D4Q0Q0_RHISA|nr:hypothetical protein HPB52_015695 [Rhipicephalus sanguineus]